MQNLLKVSNDSHETGMDPSGLVDMFEKQGLLAKQGNRLKYVDLAGNEHPTIQTMGRRKLHLIITNTASW